MQRVERRENLVQNDSRTETAVKYTVLGKNLWNCITQRVMILETASVLLYNNFLYGSVQCITGQWCEVLSSL